MIPIVTQLRSWKLRLTGTLSRLPEPNALVIKFLIALALGTAVGFSVSLFSPLAGIVGELLEPYRHALPLPALSLRQVVVVVLSIVAAGALSGIPQRLWRSLRLGLFSDFFWVWVVAWAVFWVSSESHHALIAWASLAFAFTATALIYSLGRNSAIRDQNEFPLLESDLPISEIGDDLLRRQSLIDSLVSMIILEQPEIIAVTGAYGDGKTSFLNLAINELRKRAREDPPVIVRFSPWLAGDSNTLVLSLLNSIVVEIKRRFVVPGLRGDAMRYARALLTVIPKADKLKDLIAEPSQEERIIALANRIASTRCRVLVVLDDLDRMEAKELETVFKLLRGTDKLSNVTFLCAFAPEEMAQILKVTRPSQIGSVFLEKFFPVEIPLPKISGTEYRDFLTRQFTAVIGRYQTSSTARLPKSLESIWENGGAMYFVNLRRIKLFLNGVGRSLEQIVAEVCVEDFIRLELVRKIDQSVYDTIFHNPGYFYNANFAIETRFSEFNPLNEEDGKTSRAKFYEQMVDRVPAEKQYVFKLLEALFPNFATYRKAFGSEIPNSRIGEHDRRIWHPRFFRQYFTQNVPTELFGQKEFGVFRDSAQNSTEDRACDEFNRVVRSIGGQDFKRWHFMQLIENSFVGFGSNARRGFCRGMAQISSIWPSDAFELLIATRVTKQTFLEVIGSDNRIEFLDSVIRDSASGLYSLLLLNRIEGRP